MRRTTSIAVTGSFGKTTAKDCLGAILARKGPTVHSRRNSNGRWGVASTILRVRPWHRYAVLEVGSDGPGNLFRGSLVIRPDVVLILCVGRTHTQAYRDLDEIAKEKASLARFMRRNGILVLNADDPRVKAMGADRSQRVVFFGTSATCHARAEEVHAQWPDRLSFKAVWGGEECRVQTQLVGEHWLPSVLGALAVAASVGVGLKTAAAAVATVAPYIGRMQPVTLPNGAVVLRDDYNGSIDSLQRAVEALRTARARRRILVISDCSDYRKKPRERMAQYARMARASADVVVFLGERCDYGVERAEKEGMPAGAARGFHSFAEAVEYLRSELRLGDLLLLRGLTMDHLARIYFGLLGEVGCAKTQCPEHILCDRCRHLKFRPRPDAMRELSCAE